MLPAAATAANRLCLVFLLTSVLPRLTDTHSPSSLSPLLHTAFTILLVLSFRSFFSCSFAAISFLLIDSFCISSDFARMLSTINFRCALSSNLSILFNSSPSISFFKYPSVLTLSIIPISSSSSKAFSDSGWLNSVVTISSLFTFSFDSSQEDSFCSSPSTFTLFA